MPNCFMHFFFITEIQKAKDDAEEAYNSISEVAKKEVNKMIYKSLLMILDQYMKFIYLHCGEEMKKFRPVRDLNP